MTASSRIDQSPAWRKSLQFVTYVANRFLSDQCTVRAASLTYTTLLAIVPLLAISFAIFSAFPAFDSLQMKVQLYIFENFVPQVGDTVLGYLEGFTKQTGKLTTVGIVFLVVTSVMLLLTISNAFDAIWRAKRERTLVGRLLVYWAVLTLAPLLLGASVSLSGYLFTAAQASGVEHYTGSVSHLAGYLPLLFQFAGFVVLYVVMPNSSVRLRDALIGGFTAALLFEILKKFFGFYVTAVPTYETIYGALATFPIFLIWMYISWLVVLIGAEITAALPEWRSGRHQIEEDRIDDPMRRLELALSILYVLSVAGRSGRAVSLDTLSSAASINTALLVPALAELESARFVARSESEEWCLTQDLSVETLYGLFARLGLAGEIPDTQENEPDWKGRYAEICRGLSDVTETAMATDLKTLIAAEPNVTIDDLVTPATPETPPNPNSRVARILAWIGLGWVGSS